MIIGLTGKKNSGKDTVAAYLIKEHGFERRAFADPLKRSVAALFDIPYHEIDRLKNDDSILIGMGRAGEPEYDQWITYMGVRGMTFREMLQRYGTESHRDVFGETFWLDYTLPLDGFYHGHKIVVTDCRFDNEADRIREVGGHVVKIERPGLTQQDPHSSEEDIDEHLVDAIVNNDKTIPDLFDTIEVTLSLLGSQLDLAI